jgi:tetraacyldisaccharide 4'-kinase
MNWIEKQWWRIGPWQLVLAPLALPFRLASATRRLLYRSGVVKSARLPVPVIVVGNITVGGSGKTPLVLWLAEFLRTHGWHPGIVSRGYRGRARGPLPVNAGSDPEQAGDEPVLLARRAGCPVWVGRDRVAAARALLAAEPQCNVVLADDGLQHYRLARDLEIAVVDGERRFGNGLPLPAGPLREPVSRLAETDAVVWHGAAPSGERQYAMRLVGDGFWNLLNPEALAGPGAFRGRRIHAVAGIGNPQRFFRHLRDLGLEGESLAFPDHHRYRPEELRFPDGEAVLMTEKDAVKCIPFADERMWALAVAAEVDPRLGEAVLGKIGKA